LKTLLFILFCLGLGPWTLNLRAVVQNGIVSWSPDGAVSHSIWRQSPGQSAPQYVATVTGSNYLVLGPTEAGAILYVKANQLLPTGQCCVESDLGFVVTPPVNLGTNVIRWSGPVNALLLQSAPGAAGPWTDVGLYTNAPLKLAVKPFELLRTKQTNLPPPFP
jgi:hypothetical protein